MIMGEFCVVQVAYRNLNDTITDTLNYGFRFYFMRTIKKNFWVFGQFLNSVNPLTPRYVRKIKIIKISLCYVTGIFMKHRMTFQKCFGVEK